MSIDHIDMILLQQSSWNSFFDFDFYGRRKDFPDVDAFDPSMRSQLLLELSDVQQKDVSQVFAGKMSSDIPLYGVFGTNDFNVFDVEPLPRYQEEIEMAESIEESDKNDKGTNNMFDLELPFTVYFFGCYLSSFSLKRGLSGKERPAFVFCRCTNIDSQDYFLLSRWSMI
jgi:hypothetical protein